MISPGWTLLFQNLNDCPVFPSFSFFHIWKHFWLNIVFILFEI